MARQDNLIGLGVNCEQAKELSTPYDECVSEMDFKLAISEGNNILIEDEITLTSNRTVSQAIEFLPGGKIITNGYILTINGPLYAGAFQIFDASSGSVSLGDSSTPYVFTEWWGALGNGTTDDSSAIQKAATAAANKTLLFLAKTYKIATSAISLGNGCKVTGQSYHASTIYQSTANQTSLIPGNDNEICNLKFTGTGNFSTGGRAAIDGDPTAGGLVSQRVHIHDCYIDTTVSTSGISGDNCADWIVENNLLDLGTQSEHGIYLSSGAARATIRNNIIKCTNGSNVTSNRGINIKGGSYITIQNNFIVGDFEGYGIVFSDIATTDAVITNNHIKLNNTTAVGIRTGTDGTSFDTRVLIQGNNISGGFYGVQADSKDCKILDNLIESTASRGIEIAGSGSNSVRMAIQGNAIRNCVGGIRVVTSPVSMFISDNFIEGAAGGVGISIEGGSTSGRVSENYVINSPVTHYNFAIGIVHINNLQNTTVID